MKTQSRTKTYSSNAINSKWFLTLIILLLLATYIFSIIAFTWIDGYTINSVWFKSNIISINSNYSWLAYVSITIGFIGSLMGTIGALFVVRKRKDFIYYLLIGQTCTIIDCIITGLIFTLIAYIIMEITVLSNFKGWKKEDVEDTKNTKYLKYFFIVILYLISGILIDIYFYSRLTEAKTIYLDIIAASIAIYSWYFIMQKNKIGFLGFILNDILYLILFFWIGLYVVAMGFIIYFIINILSINSYENTRKLNNINIK